MTQPNTLVAARATHYVSLINGGIYPAQTGAIGHEDANPTDWRAATAAEVARYQAGEQNVDVSPVPLGVAPAAPLSAPLTLQLTPDEPDTATAEPPVDVTPPVTPVIAEAPIVATLIPGAPIAPAPSAAPAPVVAIPPAHIE